MGLISAEATVTPVRGDKLLGTDISNTVNSPGGESANFLHEDVAYPVEALRKVTGATTVIAADRGGRIRVNSAVPVQVTIPISLGSGFNFIVTQDGVGVVTVRAASGATLRGVSQGTATLAQYDLVYVSSEAANSFDIYGIAGAVT